MSVGSSGFVDSLPGIRDILDPLRAPYVPNNSESVFFCRIKTRNAKEEPCHFPDDLASRADRATAPRVSGREHYLSPQPKQHVQPNSECDQRGEGGQAASEASHTTAPTYPLTDLSPGYGPDHERCSRLERDLARHQLADQTGGRRPERDSQRAPDGDSRRYAHHRYEERHQQESAAGADETRHGPHPQAHHSRRHSRERKAVAVVADPVASFGAKHIRTAPRPAITPKMASSSREDSHREATPPTRDPSAAAPPTMCVKSRCTVPCRPWATAPDKAAKNTWTMLMAAIVVTGRSGSPSHGGTYRRRGIMIIAPPTPRNPAIKAPTKPKMLKTARNVKLTVCPVSRTCVRHSVSWTRSYRGRVIRSRCRECLCTACPACRSIGDGSKGPERPWLECMPDGLAVPGSQHDPGQHGGPILLDGDSSSMVEGYSWETTRKPLAFSGVWAR